MEGFAQFLSSLKENEKSILVTIIANAFVIYLICFIGMNQFKTYQWYQQLLIPTSFSICYTTVFYLIIMIIVGIFSAFPKNRNFCSFMVESNFKWFLCVFTLGNILTLMEIVWTLLDEFHEFCFNKIIIGILSCIGGISLLMLIIAIWGDKITIKNDN